MISVINFYLIIEKETLFMVNYDLEMVKLRNQFNMIKLEENNEPFYF